MGDKKLVIGIIITIIVLSVILGVKIMTEKKANEVLDLAANTLTVEMESTNEVTITVDEDNLKSVFKESFFLLGVMLVVGIIAYIVFAVALSSIAREQGYKGWLAWIPVVNIYLLGQVGFENHPVKWVMLICYLFTGSMTVNDVEVNLPDMVNIIIAVVLCGLIIKALYNIYQNVQGKKVVVLIVMTVVLAVFTIINPTISKVSGDENTEVNSLYYQSDYDDYYSY